MAWAKPSPVGPFGSEGASAGAASRDDVVFAPCATARARARAWGASNAVVQDEVDPRAWGQGGELLQELDRCEQEVRGAVVPLGLERNQNESVRCQREPLLRDRRAQHVAAEALDAGAIVRRHRDVRVGVQAPEVRLARPARGDPGCAELAADLEHAGAGT